MKRPTSMPLLVPAAVLCLGLVLVEGWLLQRSRAEAAQALAALKQKKQERDWLARQSPALSPENEAAVAAELAAAGRLLGEWRSVLQGGEAGGLIGPAPATSIEAYFELAGFVGQLRAKAGQAQVGLRADERFGFGTYAHEGPPTAQIATVHRQRLAAQYLVELLLESRPLALLAVRRERPGTEAARDQRNPADDFFEPDRSLRVRQPGQIETEAFRLEFTGQTAALRHFLNNLGAGRQPVVVRSVDVELLNAENPARGSASAVASDAPMSLVTPGPAKFGVTVEFARLADNPATAAP